MTSFHPAPRAPFPAVSGESDDEIREAIASARQGVLSACDALRHFATDMLGSWDARPIEQDRPHEQLLVAIMSRSLNTYSAAVELARMGYGPQAMMLNRSLFEDMIDAHWITVEPQLSVRLFEHHHESIRMHRADELRDLELAPEDEIPTFASGERLLLTHLFGRYGEKSWTRRNIHQREREVEHLWRDEVGGRELLHFYRRIAHAEANRILHLSAYSMVMHVRARGSDGLGLDAGPSDRFVRQALPSAFYVFGQLVSLIRDTFEFGDADRWRELYDTDFGEPPEAEPV